MFSVHWFLITLLGDSGKTAAGTEFREMIFCVPCSDAIHALLAVQKPKTCTSLSYDIAKIKKIKNLPYFVFHVSILFVYEWNVRQLSLAFRIVWKAKNTLISDYIQARLRSV